MSDTNGHVNPLDTYIAQPWDRQPGETEAAYKAFRAYLEMGSERSLEAFAREHQKSKGGATTKRPHGRFTHWYSHHEWKDRSLLWDQHTSRVRQDALDQMTMWQTVDWARRKAGAIEQQYQDGYKLVDKANAALKAMQDERVDTKALRDLVAVLNTAFNLIRDAIDTALPDDDDFDPTGATIAELQAFLDRKAAQRSRRIPDQPIVP